MWVVIVLVLVVLLWGIGALLYERDKRIITARIREELTRELREEQNRLLAEKERTQEEFVAKTASGHWPRHWPRGDNT